MPNKVFNFIKECIRVFKITKKPQSLEFKSIVKVTGIGILIIGLIGFIINITWQLIK
jgi:protein transport protein SEC61 subunit gamma-like protein